MSSRTNRSGAGRRSRNPENKRNLYSALAALFLLLAVLGVKSLMGLSEPDDLYSQLLPAESQEASVQTSPVQTAPVQTTAAQTTAAQTTAAQTTAVQTTAASSSASPDEPYIARDGLEGFSADEVPEWSGEAYVAVHGNLPYFDTSAVNAAAVEYYSPLDGLSRCGMTYACVGEETMPTGERGSISSVKPSGWHSVRYDCVEGKSLYNRCHLIGYQLTAENANEQNLITGTRYLNVQGMLPFENMIADYIAETGNHVAYRVTPYFEGSELVARGVLLEAYSVEDSGEGVTFCVYAYNVQPGVRIDYATGESELSEASGTVSYILNTNTHKYHTAGCTSAPDASSKNRQEYTGTLEVLLAQGYTACSRCGGQ